MPHHTVIVYCAPETDLTERHLPSVVLSPRPGPPFTALVSTHATQTAHKSCAQTPLMPQKQRPKRGISRNTLWAGRAHWHLAPRLYSPYCARGALPALTAESVMAAKRANAVIASAAALRPDGVLNADHPAVHRVLASLLLREAPQGSCSCGGHRGGALYAVLDSRQEWKPGDWKC